MKQKIGFDNAKYIKEQATFIRKRMKQFDGRMYLEFGGKLLSDFHAARVLPGYDPNVKVQLLKELEKDAEIIVCIHAEAIEQRKVRADYGITYDADAMKLIDDLREWGLTVTGVVITRWQGQASAKSFMKKLENRGIKVYSHEPTRGYPTDIDTIVSEEGYGANPRIEVTKPLVVVTGPGPGSGKMATCLSQIYHDTIVGQKATYAKFETFPIWNLPLKHPVNMAYEAATLDMKDSILIDPFHLEATGKTAVNYNRDVESFPLLRAILQRMSPESIMYRSPTEMGVNRVGFAIADDEICREAAKQEVVRRYLRCVSEYAFGIADASAYEKADLLMKELGLSPEYRKVVPVARAIALQAQKDVAEEKPDAHYGISVFCGAALELVDGTIVTGKNSTLLHAATAAVLNGVKHLAGVPDSIPILSPLVIESIAQLKRDVFQGTNASLDVDEVLIALAIGAALTPMVQTCVDKLIELRGCKMHLTHVPTPGDEAGLRKLGVNVTADTLFASKRLYEE